jgi:hypothetical protein
MERSYLQASRARNDTNVRELSWFGFRSHIQEVVSEFQGKALTSPVRLVDLGQVSSSEIRGKHCIVTARRFSR